jgi:tetratricopeptide (TPR) repeat protein
MDQPTSLIAAEDVFQQAIAFHKQGELEQSERFYRAILTRDRNHLGALQNLGILRLQRGDCEGAVAVTREVLRQSANAPVAYITLAVALKRLGRSAEAESCCREAIRLFPEYAEAHNSLGTVLISSGRPQAAEICCREALRLNPGYAPALHNLFVALYLQQEIGEIAAWLGRSLTVNSDFLSGLLFALAYLIFGNVQLAAGVVIAGRFAQLGGLTLTGRPIQWMRWARVGLVFVLAGATIVTQNPLFLMVQPSVVHFGAAALLSRGMIRSIDPPGIQRIPRPVAVEAVYAWMALIVAFGLANLIIVLYSGLTTWLWFISFTALGAKLLQYAVFSTIVRHRFGQFAQFR